MRSEKRECRNAIDVMPRAAQRTEEHQAWQRREVPDAKIRDALVVDDHPIVREAIKELLQKHFPDIRVAESNGTASVVEDICAGNWSFVVLDMNLPDRNGLDILKTVKTRRGDIPIIVFSLYAEGQYAPRALRAGAKAYLSKDRSPEDLIDVIRTVLAGGRIKTSPYWISLRPGLSDREIQVLSLLTKGMTRKEIARVLRIHEKTVSTYRARLLEKLHLHTLVDLIRYAAEEGFVE